VIPEAAIVTCGGLCPGLNAVIRELVMMLHMYGPARSAQATFARLSEAWFCYSPGICSKQPNCFSTPQSSTFQRVL